MFSLKRFGAEALEEHFMACIVADTLAVLRSPLAAAFFDLTCVSCLDVAELRKGHVCTSG